MKLFGEIRSVTLPVHAGEPVHTGGPFHTGRCGHAVGRVIGGAPARV
jgi:hypothetical protein